MFAAAIYLKLVIQLQAPAPVLAVPILVLQLELGLFAVLIPAGIPAALPAPPDKTALIISVNQIPALVQRLQIQHLVIITCRPVIIPPTL